MNLRIFMEAIRKEKTSFPLQFEEVSLELLGCQVNRTHLRLKPAHVDRPKHPEGKGGPDDIA